MHGNALSGAILMGNLIEFSTAHGARCAAYVCSLLTYSRVHARRSQSYTCPRRNYIIMYTCVRSHGRWAKMFAVRVRAMLCVSSGNSAGIYAARIAPTQHATRTQSTRCAPPHVIVNGAHGARCRYSDGLTPHSSRAQFHCASVLGAHSRPKT